MSKLTNLTSGQRKLLAQLAKDRVLCPYGDPDALALMHADLARRTVAFGKLEITPSGRAALNEGKSDER